MYDLIDWMEVERYSEEVEAMAALEAEMEIEAIIYGGLK